jgi:hypothetical protein
MAKSRLPAYAQIVGRRFFLWLPWVVLFGHLQLLVVICRRWVRDEPTGFVGLVASGTVLFFCSGIVSSCALDVWLERRIRNRISAQFVVFHCMFPVLLLLGVVGVYIDVQDAAANPEKIVIITAVALACTMAYMFGSKMHIDVVRTFPLERASAR